MNVKFEEVAERLNIKVDQKNTDLEVYVGGEHIESRELLVHHNAPIKGSTIGYQFQFGFEVNDILFMTKNPHLRKASLAKFRGLCSIATFVIRAKNSDVLLQEYLAIEMQSDRFWNYCEEHKSGGVNYFINWGTLSQYEFDLPPIETQRAIADKVWAAYRLKEAYQRLLTATDEMVKSQFLEMTKSAEKQVRLSELLDTNVIAAKRSYKSTDIIQYIDISSIDSISKEFSQTVEYEFTNAPSRAQQCVKYGDILYSTVRPNLRNYGWVTIDSNNLVASSGFCVLRPKRNLEYYVFSIINSDNFTAKMIDKAQGGVFPAVNQSFILEQLVPIPDDKVVTQISSIYRQSDKSKFELRKAIAAIDEVIKSLING